MASWGFYGRRSELAKVRRLLGRNEFFFCAISGRRRIGKTSLIQEALSQRKQSAIYVQIPDSDERGVIQSFEDGVEDALSDKRFAQSACSSFSDISVLMRALWKNNYITAIDEFQYFHRQSLYPFLSDLQREVDSARRSKIGGGIFALGSIHTEMTAVLEDKSSPLFNRVTDRIHVDHWDFETLFEMFESHDILDPHHILFLWSLFEGIPKFYRDCFDHGVLTDHKNFREQTLRSMFFDGSSPLRDEAENWFLRELRGRYDSVLKLIARIGPCSYGELRSEYERTGPGESRQLTQYLNVLIDKYQMVEKLTPIFSGKTDRKTRYQISDNFLSAWLSSIDRAMNFARIRPIDQAIEKSKLSLAVHEGYMFEKMIKKLVSECSRKGVGDFALTSLVEGFWNKTSDSDVELDLVAVDEESKSIRFGSCKRTESAHDSDSRRRFDEHVDRFLRSKIGKRFGEWKIERALYSPVFSENIKYRMSERGYLTFDIPYFREALLGRS